MAVALLFLALESAAGQAPSADGTGPQTSGYLRIMPRFYRFSGDQGYLQRYQTLRPPNDKTVDRLAETINAFGFTVHRPGGGVPYFELRHVNPFLMNDQWFLRLAPATGLRFDLTWSDYQRGFEEFAPPTAPESISYARFFNDGIPPNDFLRRRRGEFRLDLHLDPASWRPGLRFVRDVHFELGRRNYRGYRQFNWMFGIAEDLVVPVGWEDSRWRGRTEPINQDIRRYGLGTTLAFGRNTVARFRIFGETFNNQSGLLTNADLARFDPAINTQPRTINFLPDHRLLGGDLVVEQKLTERVTLLADLLLEDLKQTSLAPLQEAAGYHSSIRTASASLTLVADVRDNTHLEAFSRWSKRKNRSQVGEALSGSRPYLMADRNLSYPFLRGLSESSFGGTFTQYVKGLAVRVGARHANARRDFIRAGGDNAIPEGLTLYRPYSTPTEVWGSISGRPSKQFRWSARSEIRTAGETYTVTDPARRYRLRGTSTVATKSGRAGVTASASFQDERNDQFALRSELSRVPQLWETRGWQAGAQAWCTPSDRWQLYAAFQHLDRDHKSAFVVTDIRRWLTSVTPSLVEQPYGYDSSAQVLSLGASLAVNSRLTLLPSLSLALADGGIISSKTPTRQYSLIANRHLGFGPGLEYKLSERNLVHLRYDYNRYDDDEASGLSGRFQAFSFGVSRVF